MKIDKLLPPDIKRALLLQLRVIFALVLRETRTTFGKSALGYLWAILIPAASIGILVLIFNAFGRPAPYGEHLAVFFALGLLTLECHRKIDSSLKSSFRSSKALLFYPPIKEFDVLIARCFLISVTYFLIFIVMCVSFYFLGMGGIPHKIDIILEGFLALVFFAFGMGVLNAVFSSRWDTWNRIHILINKPLFFISGIFYVPSYLPTIAQDVLKFNPVLHLVEWMREGYYPAYNSSILVKSYPVGLALLLTVLGLLGERFWRHKRVLL